MRIIYINNSASYAGTNETKVKGVKGIVSYYCQQLGIDEGEIYTVNYKQKAYHPAPSKIISPIPFEEDDELNYGCLSSGIMSNAGLFEYGLTNSIFGVFPKDELVIAIISNNSGHHFSWPLAKVALKRKGVGARNRYVVNIDYHEDYGNGKCSKVQCSVWGQFVTHPEYGFNNCTYVSIGNHAGRVKSKHKQLRYAVPEKLNVASKVPLSYFQSSNKEQELNLSDQKLKTLLGGGNGAYYVTVDRDFMQGNGTKYDGNIEALYSRPEGMEIVIKILQVIKKNGGEVFGFDVCGLPVAKEKKSANCAHGVTPGNDKLVSDAIEEISQYLSAIQEL